MNRILILIQRAGASCLFLGYVPLMPGTLGSLLAVSLLYMCQLHFGWQVLLQHTLAYWMALLAFSGVAVLFASRSRTVFGTEDNGRIIIDECAGQFITFFMVPLSLKTLIVGFFLFRFFDIIKPYPVYRMEELDNGLGVVMDDVVAGVCANVSLLLMLYCYHIVANVLHIS
jgi:phosphatidylglycerophosphatase A